MKRPTAVETLTDAQELRDTLGLGDNAELEALRAALMMLNIELGLEPTGDSITDLLALAMILDGVRTTNGTVYGN